MKNVYIVMYQNEHYYDEYKAVGVSGVFDSRKRAIEHIMEVFKGLVFTYDGRTDDYIREEPDQDCTRTMWIEEWEVKS